MSEMVERMARAIVFVQEGPCDPEVVARAAIEAMREPTEGMREASRYYLGASFYVDPQYNAMINAALKEIP